MNMTENDKIDMARMIVSHANSLQIHSGNIIDWFSLKKGVSQKSSEELLEAIGNAVDAWKKSIGIDLMSIEEPLRSVDIANRAIVKRIDADQRKKLKISVKIFLTQWRPELASQAVKKVCHSLDVTSLDSVIVSFPVTPLMEITNNNGNMPDFNRVKLVWREMERMVENGLIKHIGVTDFDRAGMEELHNWAKVKPTIDQVNMTNCCTVPADLIEFAKQFDIELLSHNDAPEILTARAFQTMLQNSVQDASTAEWMPSYVARYSVIVRCRGIVEAKGYVVGAEQRTGSDSENYGFF